MNSGPFLSGVRIARWSALSAGLGSIAMAGYHVPLPAKLHWRESIGDPTVGWGIEMLNFAVSELMLIGGILTVWAAYRIGTDSRLARTVVSITGCYWLGNGIFQFLHPMPLPEFLAFIRWVLIGFALFMASLHLLAVALAGRGSSSGLIGSGRIPLPMAAFVTLMPVGTWASAEYLTPWPAMNRPAKTTAPAASTAARVPEMTVALGLPGLADVTDAEELEVAASGKNIPREMYLAEWPWLAPVFVSSDHGQEAAGRLLLEEFLLDPERRGAASIVLAGIDRRKGNIEAALERVEMAQSDSSGQVLHDYQEALCQYAALFAAKNPMAKWAISKKVQSAYQKVLDARPETAAARYFLINCFASTPAAFGGDLERAMTLANEAIEANDRAFLPVRGRLYELQEKNDEAIASYDVSVDRGAFERHAFVQAIALALSRDDLVRAKRYVAFAVAADSQSAEVMEAAGDYFVAAGNEGSARKAYDAALSLSPGRESAGQKVAVLGDGK